jgi:hypothetical protein
MIGRSRQQDPEEGEWCPILYRKDKFEVVSEGIFWLSDTPDKEGTMSWGISMLEKTISPSKLSENLFAIPLASCTLG